MSVYDYAEHGYADAGLNAIAARLDSADVAIRRVAVRQLVDSQEPEAVELLVRALRDIDDSVRREAALVIDEFDAADMASALLESLTSTDENVRNAAARALADLKDANIVPALIAALGSDDVFVLASVLSALKHFRVAQSLPHAQRLLQHRMPLYAAKPLPCWVIYAIRLPWLNCNNWPCKTLLQMCGKPLSVHYLLRQEKSLPIH